MYRMRLRAVALTFGCCMATALAAPAQQTSQPASQTDARSSERAKVGDKGAASGRINNRIDNRTSTTHGTVYQQIKAQREDERQSRLHSRYQPKPNAEDGAKPFLPGSGKVAPARSPTNRAQAPDRVKAERTLPSEALRYDENGDKTKLPGTLGYVEAGGSIEVRGGYRTAPSPER